MAEFNLGSLKRDTFFSQGSFIGGSTAVNPGHKGKESSTLITLCVQ